MAENLNLRQLKVPVTNLMRKVFTRERLTACLDIGVSERGLQERGDRGDLKLELWLESCPDGIRVKGRIMGNVTMECTRCLEEYRQDLDIGVDEFYRRPGLAVVSDEGRRPLSGAEIPEEDEYVIAEGVIDLNLLVNDAVMLSLPIRHLCEENCRGLCQICGMNLNLDDCGCVREDIDPRLEVLKTLLDRKED
jgi:DUF177 domain-containing protein